MIILIILLIYFVSYLFNINSNVPTITTTTTKTIDEGFNNIPNLEKSKLNEYFNRDNLLISFNNAFDNNYNLKNINLLETEESKFKFIYTYLKLNNMDELINYETLNNYSQKVFKNYLYADNFTNYLKDDYYEYEIKYQNLDFCLNAYKQKDDILMLDMITRSENNCDINHFNYDDTLVVHKIELEYELVNDDYIYKSFIVVK